MGDGENNTPVKGTWTVFSRTFLAFFILLEIFF